MHITLSYALAALSNQLLLIVGQQRPVREVAGLSMGKELTFNRRDELRPLTKVLQEVGEMGAAQLARHSFPACNIAHWESKFAASRPPVDTII